MSDDFLFHLHDLPAGLGRVSTRAMFGGHGVYVAVDGAGPVIIGIVIDDALYLKADAQTRARFEAAGSGPFFYSHKGKQLTMSYWSVPEAAPDSPQAMLPWARLAFEAALRKPDARRGSKRRTR